MSEIFQRTELLINPEGLNRLRDCHVALFGVGGVGGYCAEALVRSGIGEIDIVDNDKVALSNINRQIIATTKTVGRYKVDVMKERLLEINPDVKVNVFKTFFLPENSGDFDFSIYDYVADAIDTVKAKIELVLKCNENTVPIISAMGAGNKLDASKFKVSDIYKTSVCPLAKVMRTELKKRGIKKLKVVYSEEIPIKTNIFGDNGKQIPGSFAPAPGTVGLIMAGEMIKDLINPTY